MLRVDHDELEPTDDHLSFKYNGSLFTGIGYEDNENGSLLCEIEYLNGQRNGKTKEWYPNGNIYIEQNYRYNTLHGKSMEWYETGAQKSETSYELGVCLRRKIWAEDGAEIENFLIDENSSQFVTLLKLRQGTIGKLILEQ